MAYKRQIDRLPIVPKDAKEFNVTCHYCIVGCGYKAYTWPTQQAGRHRRRIRTSSASTSPSSRPLKRLPGIAPSMYNIVRQNGQRRSYRHQARQGLRREFRASARCAARGWRR